LDLAESFDLKTARGEWMEALDDPRLYDGSADSAREAGRLNREIRKTQEALDRAMGPWPGGPRPWRPWRDWRGAEGGRSPTAKRIGRSHR